ncbi:MOSC domain-containing protein [Halosimplex marinum]|uniref:MOSC domain-containing protein n=1 Tax=Halosimplex marinum TaxID=3396620 RepID=UPI003F570B4B
MGRLERITVFPVKGLDGIDVEAAAVLDGGTLEYDREFALFDPEGEVLNGKRTDRVHDLTTDFDPETGTLRVETPDGAVREFDLGTERERAAEWLGDFFGTDLTLERDTSLGYVDRRGMGPSVISTATLEAVASWFDDVTVEGARRRLRANVEVSGVPAFWEDRFVGEGAPAFEAGGVRFEGVTPCGRCVVPQRDPDTGQPTPEFRERFVERRRETFPGWADEDAFDHYYTLMIITGVAEADRGRTIRVGDEVEVVE